jgi:hypothetical protein
MPDKLETTHKVIPQQLIVYQRPRSTAWQCRYNVDGVWLVKSTKNKELPEAIQESYMLLANAKVRKKQNFTVATKRFRDVAKLTLKL